MTPITVEVILTPRGEGVVASVEDRRFDVKGKFTFRRTEGSLTLRRLELFALNGPLRVTDIRKELPLGEWEAAARQGAERAFRARGATPRPPVPRRQLQGPPYAQVAARYRGLVAAGIRNPAMIISEEFGVSGTTARNWLRQCRAMSLLGPAPAPGTPGDVNLVRSARKRGA